MVWADQVVLVAERRDNMGYVPQKMIFTVDLVNFKEENIQFTKLIPKAYTEDGYDPSTCAIETKCRHWWNYVGEDHWNIYIEIFASAYINNFEYIPFYIDVDLVILNDRVWEQTNPNK